MNQYANSIAKMNVLIKISAAIFIMIFLSLGLFACSMYKRITDFDEFSDLPRNPSQVVFVTNFFSDIPFTWIYFDVPSEDIAEIMDMLFARSYRRIPSNMQVLEMDIIQEYLRIYDDTGTDWLVNLSFLRHKDRLYSPPPDGLGSKLRAIAIAYLGIT